MKPPIVKLQMLASIELVDEKHKGVDETLYSVFHQKRRLMSQFKNKRL